MCRVFCYDVEMPWSTTRQFLFALGALSIIAVLSGGSYFFFFYEPASCFDGKQNQNELGVDCDGSCALLCKQPNISALWTRSVRVAPGVYHAVALVKNPDTSSRGTVPYEVSLFDVDNILVARREGILTLLPGDIVPLFEANVVTGERVPVRTFVDFGPGRFERAERTASPVRILSFKLADEQPRLTVLLENQTALPVQDITVTALLFDENEILVNASQTTLDSLDARERKEAVFTWQEPFAELPNRVDIIPRVLP